MLRNSRSSAGRNAPGSVLNSAIDGAGIGMRYQQPTGANPVVVDGQAFTDQQDLGAALVQKYKVRSVADITTCSTCHR